MKYLILAVLLAVMQAPPPIPRQAADSAASAGQKVQKRTGNNQAPTTPSKPPVGATPTPNHDGKGNEQGTDNAQNPEIVSKLPPVTVEPQREWIDRGILILHGFLVGVGFLQWLVLRRQARLMGKHAEHLENLVNAAGNNAKAALLNAQAVINSERA